MTTKITTISIQELSASDIETKTLQKMVFICNSIDDGWQVSKKNDTYVFTKKHEGRREVFSDNYLYEFIAKNMEPITLN